MAEKSSRKRSPGLAKRMSRSFKRGIVKAVEKVDFVALLKRIGHSESGRFWLERFQSLPPAWDNQEEVQAKAVELTLAQLAQEGIAADPDEIREIASKVSCQYDYELHKYTATAVTTLMNGLFDQEDPFYPFTAKGGGRDLEYLDLLKKYRDQGLGIVYLVNHSSHFDEFVADCLLLNREVGLPLFAAGDNMMAIKSVARILMCGSYVVQRRGASRHALSVLYNYCRAVSETGKQQGIFLEAWHGGARTRDGSLRYPRRLVTLRGAIDVSGDVVVQPVAISYSAVPEDLPLADRASGYSWVRGMGWKALGRMLLHPRSWVWRSVQGLYGRAYCTLPKPFLLSELKEMHARDKGGLALDEFVALTAIREIARTKKVMASQLVARALLRARATRTRNIQTVILEELGRLKDYHHQTFHQEPDLEDFIEHHTPAEVAADGLAMLKKRGVLSKWRKDDLGYPRVKSEAGLRFYATHGDRRLYSPTADQNVVVAGALGWGFALASAVGYRMLDDKRYLNASLTVYEPRPEVAEEMSVHRAHPVLFQGRLLPKNAFITSDAPSAFKKASEVLVAVPPERLESLLTTVLTAAEQPFKLIVASRGFDPKTGKLPSQLALDLVRSRNRGDVEVFSLAGAMGPKDLVEQNPVRGILAGEGRSLERLADLFQFPPMGVDLSDDRMGVQLADIMARVYSLWGNFLRKSEKLGGMMMVGRYMAETSAETEKLGRVLGAKAHTFAASSPAWVPTYTAVGLAGESKDLGHRLGALAAKGKNVPQSAAKLAKQMEEQRRRVQAYYDLKTAHEVALRHGLNLPILAEACRVIWGE